MDNGPDATGKGSQTRRMTSDWFRNPPTDYLNVSNVTYPRNIKATVAELDESNPAVEVLYYQNQSRSFLPNGRPSDEWIIQLFVDTEDFQDATSQSTKFAALGVNSKAVLEALNPALTSVHCPLPDTVIDQHRFYPPFEQLFFAQGRILETLKHAGLGNVKEKQLRTFVSVMQIVLRKTNHSVREMAGKRNIDFDHVWTLFPPGSFVVADVMEVPHIRQVIENSATVLEPDVNSRKPLERHMPFKFASYGFDGYNFGVQVDPYMCFEWKGHVGVSSLWYRPLAFDERYEDSSLRKKAIERGRKVITYQSFHFCQYNARSQPITTKKFSAKPKLLKGRIIVDCLQARRSDAVQTGYFGLKEHAISPVPGKSKEIYQSLRQMYLTTLSRRPGAEEVTKRINFFSTYDDFLMIMKPLLPAWSLDYNDWFWIDVSKLEPVTFEENPMDKLVESSNRQMGLLNLMIKRKLDMSASEQSDYIEGLTAKEPPLIALLTGSAGTGKSATVKAIAELQQRPLLRVDLPEAGVDIADARTEYLQTLENAMAWRALLLYDNAVQLLGHAKDRAFYDQPHMAQNFVVMLEQFQGVIFLTMRDSERLLGEVSRQVRVQLKFEAFSSKKRRKIWKKVIPDAGLKVTDETIKAMAEWELNGYEIQHLISNLKLAYSMDKGGDISLDDIEAVKSLTCIGLNGDDGDSDEEDKTCRSRDASTQTTEEA